MLDWSKQLPLPPDAVAYSAQAVAQAVQAIALSCPIHLGREADRRENVGI